MNRSTLVISLDFELYWGVRDKRKLDDCAGNLMGVQKAIEEMLSLFDENAVHATWAAVGFLFHENKQQLLEKLPATLPGYKNENLCPYKYIESQERVNERLHFAPVLLKKIKEVAGQEIATHTYSHYYCLEPGQNKEAFRDDLVCAKDIARDRGLELESLVFPRNQWRQEYLPVLPELGITSYRGNQDHWMYEAVDDESQSQVVRAARLIDAYLNISGHHTYSQIQSEHGLANIPASRFLRPYSRSLRYLEKLKVKRIKDSMTHAAKSNSVFHLWWHPHNFGSNLNENLANLRAIVRHYTLLKEHYGMTSLTMSELRGLS